VTLPRQSRLATLTWLWSASAHRLREKTASRPNVWRLVTRGSGRNTRLGEAVGSVDHGGRSDPELLVDGLDTSPVTLVLANGAGIPLDAPFMTSVAERLPGPEMRVVPPTDYAAAAIGRRRRNHSTTPPM
jgi:hypothetical protein